MTKGFPALFFFLALLFAIMLQACSAPMSRQERIAYRYLKAGILKTDGRVLTYPSGELPYVVIDGVYPNDILSESMGLMMRYTLLLGERRRFEKLVWFVENRMISDYGLISWKFDAGEWKPKQSAATIDDLRIAHALLDAYERWNVVRYRTLAETIGSALMMYAVKQGCFIQDCSWGDAGMHCGETVDISYLDLLAMSKLAKYDARWHEIYDASLALVLKSKTPVGLFHDKFDIEYQRYYTKANNLINQLITSIHLAEIGIHQPRIERFLLERIGEDGRIKGRYDAHTGEAIVDYESPAVYALALRLALYYENERLIQAFKSKLFAMQNTKGEDGILRGCFGHENCHSFDTLQALLALRLARLAGY